MGIRPRINHQVLLSTCYLLSRNKNFLIKHSFGELTETWRPTRFILSPPKSLVVKCSDCPRILQRRSMRRKRLLSRVTHSATCFTIYAVLSAKSEASETRQRQWSSIYFVPSPRLRIYGEEKILLFIARVASEWKINKENLSLIPSIGHQGKEDWRTIDSRDLEKLKRGARLTLRKVKREKLTDARLRSAIIAQHKQQLQF